MNNTQLIESYIHLVIFARHWPDLAKNHKRQFENLRTLCGHHSRAFIATRALLSSTYSDRHLSSFPTINKHISAMAVFPLYVLNLQLRQRPV